jgi:hypothetical protein
MSYPIQLIRKEVFRAIQTSVKGQLRGPCEIYLPVRQAQFGRTEQSYSGNVWNHEMVDIALKTTQSLLPDSNCKKISKIEYSGHQYHENESGTSGHFYVSVDEGQLIVDPLYRDLLMLGRGWTRKWTSPYSDLLYSLPPVFVGTVQEIADLITTMGVERQKDPDHVDDQLGDIMRWYRDPNHDYDFYVNK